MFRMVKRSGITPPIMSPVKCMQNSNLGFNLLPKYLVSFRAVGVFFL